MRRTAVALALTGLAAAVVSAVPAEAAKKKPKPVKETYSVTLTPDPSANAPGVDCGVLPGSTDVHPFTVPGAGSLEVVLDSPDPTGAGVTDWDLFLSDAEGTLASGTGQTSHEEVGLTFKKKTPVTVTVCNLAGQPQGTVSLTFTPK